MLYRGKSIDYLWDSVRTYPYVANHKHGLKPKLYLFCIQQSTTTTQWLLPELAGTTLFAGPFTGAALLSSSLAQDPAAVRPIVGGGRRRAPSALRRRRRTRRRLRHGSVVADTTWLALVGALALSPQLPEEQLPRQSTLPPSETPR